MTPVTNLKDQLKRDEGEKLVVYPDSLGIPTAGVGHNLPAHGINLPIGTPITQEQSDQWLDEDIKHAEWELLTNAGWSADLDEVRQGVLINMCFNMGWSNAEGTKGLATFHHTLAMIQAGNYLGASQAMLESKWADQVGKNPPSSVHPSGGRAWRLALQMNSGQWV